MRLAAERAGLAKCRLLEEPVAAALAYGVRLKDEDELVDLAQAHLAEAHPGMEYEREHILFMAY
jgi:hypothetical protein